MGSSPMELWGFSVRIHRHSCLTSDLCLTNCGVNQVPPSLSCKSWPGSCTAQAQGPPVGPQLAPTPHMRGALGGKGLVQASLLLIKSMPRALRNPVTLLLPSTFPTLRVMLGRSRGCCAPTCALTNTLSPNLVKILHRFWFSYPIALCLYRDSGRHKTMLPPPLPSSQNSLIYF